MKHETLDQFFEVVSRKYRHHCKREGIEPTTSAFLNFLIEYKILNCDTVKKYMVVELYPKELYNRNNKTQAVLALSEKTGVSERSIWYYLKDQEYFRKR